MCLALCESKLFDSLVIFLQYGFEIKRVNMVTANKLKHTITQYAVSLRLKHVVCMYFKEHCRLCWYCISVKINLNDKDYLVILLVKQLK